VAKLGLAPQMCAVSSSRTFEDLIADAVGSDKHPVHRTPAARHHILGDIDGASVDESAR
jgi:hypothetical protein